MLEHGTGRPQKDLPLVKQSAAVVRGGRGSSGEVPRAGAVLTQGFRRTRWSDGRPITWLRVRKQTGRGEGSSGLRFDALL